MLQLGQQWERDRTERQAAFVAEEQSSNALEEDEHEEEEEKSADPAPKKGERMQRK